MKKMNFREACSILEKAGVDTSVSIRKDSPVELLFWDSGLDSWNSFCLINDDETIPTDAVADICELYL